MPCSRRSTIPGHRWRSSWCHRSGSRSRRASREPGSALDGSVGGTGGRGELPRRRDDGDRQAGGQCELRRSVHVIPCRGSCLGAWWGVEVWEDDDGRTVRVASIVSRHRVGRRVDVTSAPKVPHCSAGSTTRSTSKSQAASRVAKLRRYDEHRTHREHCPTIAGTTTSPRIRYRRILDSSHAVPGTGRACGWQALGMTSVEPELWVGDPAAAIDFYAQAFDATVAPPRRPRQRPRCPACGR